MINRESEDYEIYEIFKDQFAIQVGQIKKSIIDLSEDKNYLASVNTLFRIFHNLKANTLHFDFRPIAALSQKAENILNSLRNSSGPAQECIVEWLQKAYEQCLLWQDEMFGEASEFSEVNPWLFLIGSINEEKISLPMLLKEQSVLYFDTNASRVENIYSQLQNSVKAFYKAGSFASFEQILAEQRADICIVNVGENCIRAFALQQQYIPDGAFVAVVENLDKQTALKLGIKGVSHTLQAPVSFEHLYRELLVIADSYFTQRRCVITNKKIQDFILTLKPLPNSIIRIGQICNDPNLAVQDLVKIVKQDPIITGQILRAANNPMFGLQEISSIDHAVAIFGMKRVQAIALSHMIDELRSVDLSMYAINEEIFSSVAAQRMTLVVKWFSKVSVSQLSILSITAILGNIGQLLIAKEISRLGKDEDFKEMLKTKSPQICEEKMVNTTTPLVSSDIVSYWKLHKDIVDSIRFSDDPKTASEEIADLALVNHVIYRLISIDGKIEESLPQKFQKLLDARGLKSAALQKALDEINKINKENKRP
jgi:HD-like signal output (HDOD) protein